MKKMAKIPSVFTNYHGVPVVANFLRQLKPNVGTYAWQPNTSTVKRQGPHERGATFVNAGKSGVGGVDASAVVTGNDTMGPGRRA